MISKHGAALIADDARQALVRLLLPETFPGDSQSARSRGAGRDRSGGRGSDGGSRQHIAQMGPKAVLVKGGHLTDDAVDLLYYQGQVQKFTARRVPSENTHGTGCTYSAAITAALAKGTSWRRD